MESENHSLEQYLHAHIPLSAAMGVSVVQVADEAITLSAPLEPNINHRDTVFGGSASASSKRWLGFPIGSHVQQPHAPPLLRKRSTHRLVSRA